MLQGVTNWKPHPGLEVKVAAATKLMKKVIADYSYGCTYTPLTETAFCRKIFLTHFYFVVHYNRAFYIEKEKVLLDTL